MGIQRPDVVQKETGLSKGQIAAGKRKFQQYYDQAMREAQ